MYYCEICDSSYNNKSNLNKHMKTKKHIMKEQGQNRSDDCPHCGKHFSSGYKYIMEKHIPKMHTYDIDKIEHVRRCMRIKMKNLNRNGESMTIIGETPTLTNMNDHLNERIKEFKDKIDRGNCDVDKIKNKIRRAERKKTEIRTNLKELKMVNEEYKILGDILKGDMSKTNTEINKIIRKWDPKVKEERNRKQREYRRYNNNPRNKKDKFDNMKTEIKPKKKAPKKKQTIEVVIKSKDCITMDDMMKIDVKLGRKFGSQLIAKCKQTKGKMDDDKDKILRKLLTDMQEIGKQLQQSIKQNNQMMIYHSMVKYASLSPENDETIYNMIRDHGSDDESSGEDVYISHESSEEGITWDRDDIRLEIRENKFKNTDIRKAIRTLRDNYTHYKVTMTDNKDQPDIEITECYENAVSLIKSYEGRKSDTIEGYDDMAMRIHQIKSNALQVIR